MGQELGALTHVEGRRRQIILIRSDLEEQIFSWRRSASMVSVNVSTGSTGRITHLQRSPCFTVDDDVRPTECVSNVRIKHAAGGWGW